jgi:hypothetical protein
MQSVSSQNIAAADLVERSSSASGTDTSDTRNIRAFGVLAIVLAGINVIPLALALINWLVWPITLPDRLQLETWVGGLLVAQSTLMPIWLCLATLRFRTRLFAGVFAFGVLRVTAFGARRAFGPLVEPIWLWIIADLVFILSLSAVLAYFRYSRGWQLVGPERYGVVPQRRAVRFRLLHVFIVTAVVGVLVALRLRWEIVGGYIRIIIAGQLVALVVVPTIGLVLGLRRSSLATLTDGGILIAMSGFVAWSFANAPMSELMIILTSYATILASCVWLRICRLRLISA